MRAGRPLTWILLGLAALLLLGVRAFLAPPAAEAPPAGGPGPAPPRQEAGSGAEDLARELAALRAALEDERRARQRLGREVAALRAALGAAEPEPGASPAVPAPAPPGPAAQEGDPPPGGGFDEAALLDAGFAPYEVAEIRGRVEAIELERLYLRDRALREGWSGTPRFRQAYRALGEQEEALRQEFGEDRYDWLLYASGRSNRVRVTSVLAGSPAGEAGVEAGDRIVSYGGARLFDVSELRDATTGGRAGESVELEVRRGDETVRLFVPRGPLGVRLDETRERPKG